MIDHPWFGLQLSTVLIFTPRTNGKRAVRDQSVRQRALLAASESHNPRYAKGDARAHTDTHSPYLVLKSELLGHTGVLNVPSYSMSPQDNRKNCRK